jgi:PAS domain S-box-containing protein
VVDLTAGVAQEANTLLSDEMTSINALGSDGELKQLVRQLVGLLRERRPGGLLEVLAPILAERDRELSPELSGKGAAILEAYDRLILAALSMRYDALDSAVSQTSFAVAEIDGAGKISYANEALRKMLPDALGRDFAALFGPRSRDVSGALTSVKRETLRLDLHAGNSASVHLRGEIGPLSDEHDRLGAYALLLDVQGEEARFDALPDGILRLDPNGNVVFANPSAKEIFGDTSDLLLGRSVFKLFGAGKWISDPPPIQSWLSSVEGHKELTEVQTLDGREAMPVRVTIVPSFDTAESRSGWVLTIVPVAEELARAEMQRLLSMPESEPEALVRGIMRAIQWIIPYDLATFGIYTEDMTHFNTLVVHPQPEWAWTTAWFPLQPGIRDFLLGGKTWSSDLQASAKELAPNLDDDQVFKNIVLKSKMQGFVTLPITGGGKEVRASLTLLSKQADRYNGREIDQMRELGVEKALLVAEANIVRRHDDRVRALEAKLADATEYKGLASALAYGIADCFEWDYVAVFGIDRRENFFRLIDQCNRTGGPDVDRKYKQNLNEGLLGAALRANAPRDEPNIEAGSRHGYKPVVPGRRSALAMPVRVVQQAAKPTSDEIEWLLSVESSQRNAFQGPKMDALKKLLAQCEGILRQRWQNAVQTSLLDAVEQAVVVVDRAGQIRLTNRWANALFCRDSGQLLGRMIADFGAEEPDRQRLRSASLLAQGRVMLSPGEAVCVPTLATRIEINDDYRHQLLLFTDLREQDQQSNWGYLEETVNEVAKNARLPLMLARSLVRDATKHLIKESEIAGLLDAAIRHLGKADITYERLANTLAVRQEPERPPQLFDAVEILQQAVADLPDDDARHCELTDVPKEYEPFLINGWPEQLSFAFRSLLGYLLFQRPNNSDVRIALHTTPEGNLRVLLSVPVLSESAAPEKPTDRIGIAEVRAREAVSLASDAVTLAIRRHNGEFLTETQNGFTSAFSIDLAPAGTEPSAKES